MTLELLIILALLAPLIIVGIIVLLNADRKVDAAYKRYNTTMDLADEELKHVKLLRQNAMQVVGRVNVELKESGGVAGTIGKGVLGCLVTLGAQELGKLSQEQQGKVNMARKGLEVMGKELFSSLGGIVSQLGGSQPSGEGGGGGSNPLASILGMLGGGGGGGIENILGMLGGMGGGKKKEGTGPGSEGSFQ